MSSDHKENEEFFCGVLLQNEREVMLGTILALIHAHRRCQALDREALTQLDAKLKEERKKASEVVKKQNALQLFLP